MNGGFDIKTYHLINRDRKRWKLNNEKCFERALLKSEDNLKNPLINVYEWRTYLLYMYTESKYGEQLNNYCSWL